MNAYPDTIEACHKLIDALRVILAEIAEALPTCGNCRRADLGPEKAPCCTCLAFEGTPDGIPQSWLPETDLSAVAHAMPNCHNCLGRLCNGCVARGAAYDDMPSGWEPEDR